MPNRLISGTLRSLRLCVKQKSATSKLALRARVVCYAVLSVLLGASSSVAQPRLDAVTPVAVQQGCDVELTFTGAQLDGPHTLLAYRDGIDAVALTPVDGAKVVAKCRIADDCRPGPLAMRLCGQSGISTLRTITVTPLPVAAELEPNPATQPQSVSLPATMVGVIADEDVDAFAFDALAGTRISAELEGVRLGNQFYDPCLELRDPSGQVIAFADDSTLTRQDPWLSVVAPATGRYTLLVRERARGGGPRCHYALHIGSFPRPSLTFPGGGQPGEKVLLTFPAEPQFPATEIALPTDDATKHDWYFSDERGSVPSPLPLHVSRHPNFVETEPNQPREHANLVPVPAVICGVLDSADERDLFRFSAKKGEAWTFRSVSRSILRSPVDLVLRMHEAEGKYLTSNDDSGGPDSYLEFHVPADGDYLLEVVDLLGRGGPEFVYRIVVDAPEIKTVLTVPPRAVNVPTVIAVPRNNRMAVLVTAARWTHNAAIELKCDGLPVGVTASSMTIGPGRDRVPIVFHADADAPVSGTLVEVSGESTVGDRIIKSSFRERTPLAIGENNHDMWGYDADRLAMSVNPPAPFELTLDRPTEPLVRSGERQLIARVVRNDGFSAPVHVRMLGNPPGVSAPSSTTIPEGADETPIAVTANADAAVGSWPIVLVGHMTVEGIYYEVSSELVSIDVETEAPVGFQRDIVPILTRYGCNAGTCHGAARGQNGFHLSLFGFDPRGDHQRITAESDQPRIHLAEPADSLLLKKATGAIPHKGGKRFDVSHRHYQVLLRWITEGAPFDEAALPVASVSISPSEILLDGPATPPPLTVTATYSDGTERDVTDLAVFRSSNETVAMVTDARSIRPGIRGEAFITARFDVHTAGIPVIVLPESVPFDALSHEGNYIDELVLAKLTKLRLMPGPLCSDEEFIRRATVDTIGLLPTEEERAAFLADGSLDKRERLVDALLARPEFADVWASYWADVLMVREQPGLVSRKPMVQFAEWLHEQFAANRPLDEMAREIITVRGTTFEHPAGNFYVAQPDRLKVAENVAQLFLGVRLQCAQCHHHPFDRWTMDDYYGFARFFAGIYRKAGDDYRNWSVWSGGAELKHPVTGAVVTARFLGGDPAQYTGLDPRPVLADWITAPDNPYFAAAMANRIWAHYLGQGIVEPVDDFQVSNPPVNAALYERLGEQLREYKYDLRRLARDILVSKTYQRAIARPGDIADERNFTHASVRRMPSTTLLDCLSQVTDSPEKFRGLPLGARANQTVDHAPENVFLSTFGRSQRTTPCQLEARSEPTLSQALHLINGSTIHQKIQQGALVEKWLDAGQSPSQVIDRLYLRCLGRWPTDDERAELDRYVHDAATPVEGVRDVFWALLNSAEFVMNR